MTPKTLFILILKVFGLFFIRDLFTVIPQLFSLSAFIDINAPVTQYIGPLITLLVLLVLYILIICLLLFKTAWVVEKLSLQKGFEQDTLHFNLDQAVVLRIIIVVLSGLIFINEIPNIIKFLSIYFSQLNFVRTSHPDLSNITWASAKLMIAALLMIFQRAITRLIQNKKSEQ